MVVLIIIILIALYGYSRYRKMQHDRTMQEKATILEGQFEEIHQDHKK